MGGWGVSLAGEVPCCGENMDRWDEERETKKLLGG